MALKGCLSKGFRLGCVCFSPCITSFTSKVSHLCFRSHPNLSCTSYGTLVAPAVPTPPFPSYGFAANSLRGPAAYRITVVTGKARGAGTNSPAKLKLIGTEGESDYYVIADSELSGLPRGSSKKFEVTVPRELGPIKRLVVEKAKATAGEIADGWFLQHVEIETPNGDKWIFPCQSWLGQSDCGGIEGSTVRNLLPSSATTIPEEEIKAEPVTVQAAGMSIPHPDKVLKSQMKAMNRQHYGYGGEDAYFYCHGKNDVFGMGVADGVYMWKEQGIDSGDMSKNLMRTARHYVQAGFEDVLAVLQASARHVSSEGVMGSSTISLLTINKAHGVLHAANLGDSGFLVLGPTTPGGWQMHIKFRTNQLEHEFGCPYQLGHQPGANTPEDADLATFPVVKGDVIIMGSDGLLDNVSDTELLQEVRTWYRKRPIHVNTLVHRLVKVAFDSSMDKQKVTPYSRAASEAFDMCYSGGKKDDITVLAALIS